MSTSMPHSSMSRCVVPRPVIASTTSSASEFCSLSSFATPGVQWRTAGRGFSGLHEDGAGFKTERGFHLVEREGLAIGCGDDVDFAAEGLGEGRPALAELAGREHEDAVAGRGEVRHRGFHGTGAGGGKNDEGRRPGCRRNL